jgi:hypothetical protein
MANFKAFKGGKSKAAKGLARFSEVLVPRAELLLEKVDGEWGFDIDTANNMLAQLAAHGDGDGPRESVSDENENENDSGETDVAPVASGNMFGAIASTLGAVAVTTPAPAKRAPVADREAYTIEKDRPEQNGIKRPSAGGLCRAVWDEMDALRESLGECPTPSMVRTAASENNWNANNAMIEYYQWRKFNGITGRIVKAKVVEVAAPAPVAATEPA